VWGHATRYADSLQNIKSGSDVQDRRALRGRSGEGRRSCEENAFAFHDTLGIAAHLSQGDTVLITGGSTSARARLRVTLSPVTQTIHAEC